MYPVTKVIEKVMLPIGTKPVIDYLLDDALECEINKFIIIINKNKTTLKK